MTGKEFLDKLRESGTGESKLRPAYEHLAAHPKAGAMALLDKLKAGGAARGTMEKAYALLGMPVPPEPEPGLAARTVFPVRSPEGGCKVAGVTYPAGAVVPTAVVEAATPDELQVLVAGNPPRGAHPPESPKDKDKK